MDLELLLAHADDGQPALDEGLPADATGAAPRPGSERAGEALASNAPEADPGDLSLQRWGVIAPEGSRGDALLEAMTPLLQLREKEQGSRPTVYRVAPDMDASQSLLWRDDVYWDEDVAEHDRPRYLLVLGDLDQVSLELQHTMAHSTFIGRVHVGGASGALDHDDLDGYAAYAAKVVQHATNPSRHEHPDVLFFTARDGTAATEVGHQQLVAPCLATAESWWNSDKLDAAEIVELTGEVEYVEDFFDAVDTPRPAVLLSVSHGAGAPRMGWKSVERQRASQGALVLNRGVLLDAEALRDQRFLPGGLWFCLACFGAGTPAHSAYRPWLTELARQDRWSQPISAVLGSLPGPGDPPFVAAMPQAALANPDGPLAVIGHMDLAWSCGFTDARDLTRSRSSRMLSAIRTWIQGARAGIALDALLRFYREANDALTVSYQDQADATSRNRPDPTDIAERGQVWMLRNDLRGYVLLGDPAARLPLHGTGTGGVIADPGSSGAMDAGAREAAVQALLRGDEPPRAIAARHGVSLDTLWVWLAASRAGR